MKAQLNRYFSSWWMSTALAVVALVIVCGQAALFGKHWASKALLLLLVAAILTIPAAALHQFVTRSWKTGLLTLLLAVPVGAMSLIAVIYVSFVTPSEDGFGKDIVVPPEMVLELPREGDAAAGPVANDEEGRELAVAHSPGPGSADDTTVSIDLDVMNTFVGANRSLLLRHLASSAKWIVKEEDGEIYATRRFVTTGGRWSTGSNGFFLGRDVDGVSVDDLKQFRIILGLDGPVTDHSWPWGRTTTRAAVGAGSVALEVTRSVNRGYESNLVLRSQGPALEISDDARTRSRGFTALALSRIAAELEALWRSETARARGFDPSLMPPESITRGGAEIHLVNGLQGGIYQVYAYVNPGEDGHVYLKAFEATRNTRLSEGAIEPRSTEYVGWSDDPEELFFYNTQITVYEGDWDVYYPARFELWFVPASGGPERKLLEKIFRIEGWQR